jgi:CheY-like chemotaxis protein
MAAPQTVLLVDDDAEIVAALRAVLEQRGYRVVCAADGNAGLAAAEREQPDLIVVDMMMPHQSGLVVLEKIKGRPGPGPRVVMITANEGPRHRAYAERLGVDAYLNKPFAVERFLEIVGRLLPS